MEEEEMEWMCYRCGRQLPIANRQVHEARCSRTHAPPPAPPADGNPEEQSSLNPESPNVFTPYTPPPAAAPWREVDVQAVAAAAAAVADRERERERGWREDGTPSVSAPEVFPSGARTERSTSEEAEAEFWQSALGEETATLPHRAGSGDGGERPGSAAGAARRGPSGSRGQEERAFVRPEARAGGGGGDDGTAGGWACTACTFLNEDRGRPRCAMCGTRMPAEERPPDGTYHDTLIVDGHGRGPGARGAPLPSMASTLLAAAEAAQCRLLEQAAARGVSTRGGGSGGRVTDGDDPESRRGGGVSSMSDAATGSAIGALGAGMLSALSTGARPSRVLASMVQGALVGGVTGVALGACGRQDSGGRREERGGGTGRAGDSDSDSGLDVLDPSHPLSVLYMQQQLDESDSGPREQGRGVGGAGGGGGRRRRRVGVSTFADPGSQGRVADDLEVLMMMQHMRTMGLLEAERREIMGDLLVPFHPEGRPARVGGGGRLRVVEVVATEEGDGNRPASAASLAGLPEEILTASSLSRLPEDGRQCCICLEDFGARDVVTRLPCLHLYHEVCIKSWLQTSDTCPQCKHRVD